MTKKTLPVIENVPDHFGLSIAALTELGKGGMFAGYLLHPSHRRAALATVAALDAPVWGFMDMRALTDIENLRPDFAMLHYPFKCAPNRIPSNFPDYTPGNMKSLLAAAPGEPDRSFLTVRIPQAGVKPADQTKVAFFSYMGMVRFFEESARIFPERQTPLPFTAKGRRLIMRHWRARMDTLDKA